MLKTPRITLRKAAHLMRPARALALAAGFAALSCGVCRASDAPADPHPDAGDVTVSMPCNASMVFRKVYTGKGSHPSCIFRDQPYAANECAVRGNFEDEGGVYFLLAKYELSEYQYRVLTEKDCPVPSKQLELPAVGHSRDEFLQAASRYSAFLQKNSDTPSQGGVKGTVSLPSDCDWSFALRGGLKVAKEDLRKKDPGKAFGSQNLRDFAWYQGSESAAGRLQLPGRLKPNVLGLYDMLGNAAEIMEERYNGGGMTVRGGSFLTPKAEMDSELRRERPLYSKNGTPASGKDLGTRFELGVAYIVSIQDAERKEELEKAEAKELALEGSQTAGADASEDALILRDWHMDLAKNLQEDFQNRMADPALQKISEEEIARLAGGAFYLNVGDYSYGLNSSGWVCGVNSYKTEKNFGYLMLKDFRGDQLIEVTLDKTLIEDEFIRKLLNSRAYCVFGTVRGDANSGSIRLYGDRFLKTLK